MKSLNDIGINGLTNSKYALFISSLNIANANSPNYSRRDAIFSSTKGQWVAEPEIRRLYEKGLTNTLQTSTSALAKTDRILENLLHLEQLFGEKGYNLSHAFSESLKVLNTANANANSLETRELYLSQLQTISQRFNALSLQLDEEQNKLNLELRAGVSTINELSSQVASLNASINAQSDEDLALLDRRDELLAELAKHIDFSTKIKDKGQVDLILANGASLVSAQGAHALSTCPKEDEPTMLSILSSENGLKLDSILKGGELTGLLSYQNTSLHEAKLALNGLALVFAQKFNTQNQLGMDLNAKLGGLVFNEINQAATSKARVSAASSNQGNASLSLVITQAEFLKNSDYELQIDANNNYQLIRQSDKSLVSEGLLPTIPGQVFADGFTLELNHANFIQGDKYYLSPNKDGAKNMRLNLNDASQLALAMPIACNARSTNQGRGSIQASNITNREAASFSLPGQLNPPILISFTSATSYSIFNADDKSLIAANLSYDSSQENEIFPTSTGFDPGYRASLSGNIAMGDSFSIDYNSQGLSDNRNGIKLTELYQQASLESNPLNFSQNYDFILNHIATQTKFAQTNFDSQSLFQAQAQNRRDQVSAVSLEEETLNLAQFQQSYEASAQIIDMGKKLFDIVLGMTRSYP